MKRMALKFLNKKGWHTGSLRNIENVWTNEQKHDAKQKKLEELRKQIYEEQEVVNHDCSRKKLASSRDWRGWISCTSPDSLWGTALRGARSQLFNFRSLTIQLPRSQLFNFPDDSSSDDASVSSS